MIGRIIIPDKLGKAIAKLVNKYLEAKEREDIRKPIVYSLDRAWKEFDKNEK